MLAITVTASAVAMAPDNNDNAANLPTEEAVQITAAAYTMTDEANPDPTSVDTSTEVVVHQDATAAFQQDAALLATQAGMAVDEAQQIFSFQDAFAKFTEEYVFPRYEDQISAIWPDIETSTGYIRFVGEVPDDVYSEAARRGLNVVVSGDGELSMAQQRSRSSLAAQALADAGYRNFTVGSDEQRGVIEIVLRVPESQPVPTNAEIVQLINDYIATHQPVPEAQTLTGQAATVTLDEVELDISIGNEPLVIVGEGPPDQDEDSLLATWDPTKVDLFHAASGGEGPLVFEDGCVFIENPNGSLVLPIWPEPTSWDPDTRTINYVSPVRNL